MAAAAARPCSAAADGLIHESVTVTAVGSEVEGDPVGRAAAGADVIGAGWSVS